LAKQVPGKEEFHETIRYFNNRLKEAGVTMKLGQRADVDSLAGFDKVVLATGIKARNLTIPGADHQKVVPYEDVLTGKVKISSDSNVAIIGAGGIGFDIATFLTHQKPANTDHEGPEAIERYMQEWGVDMTYTARGGLLQNSTDKKEETKHRNVYLLQRTKGKPGAGLGKTTGWIHRATLKKTGVHMTGGVEEYVKVDDAGLHIKLKGKVEVLDVDYVIVCAGQDPLKELLEPLKASGISTFLIGGSEAATELDAKRAIDQGTRLSAVIETAKDGEVFNQPVAFQADIVKHVRRLTGRNFA
jgi:2,4-dienoyl-CoA reductase (NADPH2)